MLDKSQPEYGKRLDQLQRDAKVLGGHPRGVFCFKTFAELNEWKEKYENLASREFGDEIPSE